MTPIKVLLSLLVINYYIQAQTTYYISNSEGNDSNNGTSISSPWKSLDKLHSSWNLIGAGDSILLKRGNTWTVTSKPSNRNGLIEVPNGKAGTPNNYIVIGAYGTGNKPVIDGTAINVYHQTIRTGGLSYFIFQDLDIRTTRGQLQFRAVDHFGGIHHIKFLSVDFTGTTIAQPDANIDFYNPPVGGYQNPSPNTYRPLHTIEIGYCTFSYTGGEDAIGLDNATNADHSGTNIWIHHNEFYSVSEEMFDIGGGNNHLIEYNFGSGIGTNGIKIHSQAMECNYGIIRGNVILHVGMGDAGTGTFPDNPTMANGNAFALWNLKGWKIYNNTVNSRWAFALGNSKVGSQIPFGRLEDNEIYNNTFYGSVQIIYYNLSTIGEPTIPLARDGNVFHHNTYYAPLESPKIRFWGSTSNIIDAETVTSANFTSAWSERFGYSNEVYEDFLPVNPTWTSFYNYGDMSLQESSPAVNDGVNSDGYSLDILGNIVPQDGITDRGAYEFNGVDITSPRVTSASLLNATTLLISFSEPLNIATAQNTNNYNISNGVTVSNAAISSYQVTLTTSVHPSGNFTVTVNNVQDMAGNIISSNNTASYTFNQDNEGPELVSAQINNATTVIVNFSEAINEADAETINNYIINNGISVTEAVLSDASKVTLTTSLHLPGNYTLTVINVRDIIGNTINAQSNSANYFLNNLVSDTLAISSYNFIQGSDANLIYDAAQEGDPVNLIIEDLNAVSWLEPYGIGINAPTKILSKLPSNKITQACKQSNEISVEVWLRPTTLTQNGPARIVSLSADPNVRNFTLGQSESNGVNGVFDFRLRTTESNSNGLPSVTSQEGYMSASELNHFVYTHNSNGKSRIFVNAIEVASEIIGGDFSNWDDSFHLILGNEFTGDRPWLGEIYKLSIYNVALSEYKIDSLFSINLVTDLNVNNSEKLPSFFFLEQNYPNPFNPTTKIKFSLPETAQISLKIYDTLGKEVAVLADKVVLAGNHSYSFNAENLSSGIYFYTLRSRNIVLTKKMLLMK